MANPITDYQNTMQNVVNKSSTNTGAATTRNTGELGQDDFLKLLLTQLQYQDPLKPMEDQQFIGQMAQFSALAQMKSMSSSMIQNQAYSLIGKYVNATITDEKTNESKAVEGVVTGVKISSGKATVIVNGEEIPIENVTDITDADLNPSNISNYTGLVGYDVKGSMKDSDNKNIVSVAGTVTSVVKGATQNYAVMANVNVKISGIDNGTNSTDPDSIKNYLESNKGKQVSVKIKDAVSGQEVSIKGKLYSYSVDAEGKVTAVLDELNLPVNNITSVTPAKYYDQGSSDISNYTGLIGYNVKGVLGDSGNNNIVLVTGKATSIEKGANGNYAVMDNVSVDVSDVENSTTSHDQDYIKNYLESNKGKQVSLKIKDAVSGQIVPVEGRLNSYNIDGSGNVTAVLDKLNLPVNNIIGVTPA